MKIVKNIHEFSNYDIIERVVSCWSNKAEDKGRQIGMAQTINSH